MSESNVAENAQLLLLYNNTDWEAVGDAGGLRGSSVAGSFYVSLHTSDPGEAGDQTTNECAYTSYARVAVPRSSAGWTVSGNEASNTEILEWPQATGGSETATHFRIGTASSGAGIVLGTGELSGGGIAIATNTVPTAAAGSVTHTKD